MLRSMFGDEESSEESSSDEAPPAPASPLAPAPTPPLPPPPASPPFAPSYSASVVSGVSVLQLPSAGISSQLWPAALHLADFLLGLPSLLPPAPAGEPPHRARVRGRCGELREHLLPLLRRSEPPLSLLELGAGVGLTSLKLAGSLPGSYVATDLESALPLLEANIAANASSHASSRVSAAPLRWGDADHHASLRAVLPPPAVVLAADCVYWEALHAPLRATLGFLLGEYPSAVVLIAGARRWKRDTAFYASLGGKSTNMRCELVSESVEEIEEERDVLEGGGERKREIMRVYAVVNKQSPLFK